MFTDFAQIFVKGVFIHFEYDSEVRLRKLIFGTQLTTLAVDVKAGFQKSLIAVHYENKTN